MGSRPPRASRALSRSPTRLRGRRRPRAAATTADQPAAHEDVESLRRSRSGRGHRPRRPSRRLRPRRRLRSRRPPRPLPLPQRAPSPAPALAPPPPPRAGARFRPRHRAARRRHAGKVVSGVDLADAQLRGAPLAGSTWEQVELSGALLAQVNLTGATMRATRMLRRRPHRRDPRERPTCAGRASARGRSPAPTCGWRASTWPTSRGYQSGADAGIAGQRWSSACSWRRVFGEAADLRACPECRTDVARAVVSRGATSGREVQAAPRRRGRPQRREDGDGRPDGHLPRRDAGARLARRRPGGARRLSTARTCARPICAAPSSAARAP